MTSLVLLGLCAIVPWATCAAWRPATSPSWPEPVRDRRLGRFRRNTLWVGAAQVIAAAAAGAWWVDAALATRWPIAGGWFFASLCAVTAWASLALGRRTREEAAVMPALQTIGRTVQMAFVPVVGLGLSLSIGAAVHALGGLGPVTGGLAMAVLSVASVLVLSPWLAMVLRVWRVLPRRIEAGSQSWRVAHLPVPSPFFVHAAALPWLRAILLSDGLFSHAPPDHWRALAEYELSGAPAPRQEHALRWAFALPLCASAFVMAGIVGAGDVRAWVAATSVAVFFTLVAGWTANRLPSSKPGLGAEGPSLRELAQSLRSLPSPHGQALPRTSRRPLGSALYDQLFALGHDPGPRPQP